MKEIITLGSAGSIAGFPGTHGPGVYVIDWDARTVTLVDAESPVIETQSESLPIPLPVPEPEEKPIPAAAPELDETELKQVDEAE